MLSAAHSDLLYAWCSSLPLDGTSAVYLKHNFNTLLLCVSKLCTEKNKSLDLNGRHPNMRPLKIKQQNRFFQVMYS